MSVSAIYITKNTLPVLDLKQDSTNMKKILTLMCFISVWVYGAQAQNRLALSDKDNVLSDEVKNQLILKLKKKNIDYNNSVNFDEMCKHKFATLSRSGLDLVLEMKNCEEKKATPRFLSSQILESDADEISTVLAYNLSEMYAGSFSTAAAVNGKPSASGKSANDSVFEHDSRYFFAPSSYNLKRGELYYQSVMFFTHDVQYGITDDFSVGMGTTLITIPFYVTPKYSFKINEKNRVAVGDMLILGTWGIRAWGNLAYATYTYGTNDRNITLGAAHLYAAGDPDNMDFKPLSRPVGNLSATVPVSEHIHFMTENYFVPGRYTYNVYNLAQNFNKDIEVKNNMVFGFTGFRLVNKNKDVMSWQVGLFYLLQNIQPLPAEYDQAPWSGGYGVDFPRFVLPALSFTQKFGKKY